MTIYEMFNNFINSWYFVTIILGSVLIVVTRKSLSKLIDRIRISFKGKGILGDSYGDQQKDKNISKKSSKEYKKIKMLLTDFGVKDVDELGRLFEKNRKGLEVSVGARTNLFELWKHYMFLFFQLYLVLRTKLILIWIYNNPNSTKELILLNMIIPDVIENKELEREAMFNALIRHSLIEKDESDLFRVTNIGRDFLQSSGLIKQL